MTRCPQCRMVNCHKMDCTDPSARAPSAQREWTEAELLAEKPRGELLYRASDQTLWEVFVCHGCQMCWPENEGDEEAYPHFTSGKALVEVTV